MAPPQFQSVWGELALELGNSNNMEHIAHFGFEVLGGEQEGIQAKSADETGLREGGTLLDEYLGCRLLDD